MKNVLISIAIATFGISANADCSQPIQQALQCESQDYKMVNVVRDYGRPSRCKVAMSPGDDRRSQTIYSWDDSGIMATVNNNDACSASFAILPSPAVKILAIAGRGVVSAQDGNFYVVGRNGQISEVLNSEKESLSVKGLKGADGGKAVEITAKDGNVFTWDSDVISRKLNGDSRKAKILGFGR